MILNVKSMIYLVKQYFYISTRYFLRLALPPKRINLEFVPLQFHCNGGARLKVSGLLQFRNGECGGTDGDGVAGRRGDLVAGVGHGDVTRFGVSQKT